MSMFEGVETHEMKDLLVWLNGVADKATTQELEAWCDLYLKINTKWRKLHTTPPPAPSAPRAPAKKRKRSPSRVSKPKLEVRRRLVYDEIEDSDEPGSLKDFIDDEASED
jgi:hypothetical protein